MVLSTVFEIDRDPSIGIYNTTMLVSTKILRQYSDRTQVVREWRVVQVPEEDARTTDISTLFHRILDYVYDLLEPFRPLKTDQDAPIRAEIGSSQNSTDFQGIPVTVCITDAVSFYIKLFILCENEEATCLQTAQRGRNAFEVSLYRFRMLCMQLLGQEIISICRTFMCNLHAGIDGCSTNPMPPNTSLRPGCSAK